MSRFRTTLGGLALLVACLAACGTPEAEPPVERSLDGTDPDSASAIRQLVRAAREEPQAAGARAALGAAYEASGMLEAAEMEYEQAARLDPSEPRFAYSLACVQAHRGQLDLALTNLGPVLELEPEYLPAHVRRGGWLLDLGDLDGAEASFERALELAPASTIARVGLARVRLKAGRPVEALSLLNQIPDAERGPFVHQMLGLALRETGDLEAARRSLARAAPGARPASVSDPWQQEKRRYRSGVAARVRDVESLLSRRRFAEAIPLLERLTREFPDDPGLLKGLALARGVALGPEHERDLLLEGLARHPDNLDLHLRLSSLYRSAGNADRAMHHADRAVAIRPTSAAAQAQRAELLLDARRLDEAALAFETALLYDATDGRVLFAAAVLDSRSGNYGRAIERLERALKLDPSSGPAWVALAGARVESGQLEEARAAFERARQIVPGHPQLPTLERRIAERSERVP